MITTEASQGWRAEVMGSVCSSWSSEYCVILNLQNWGEIRSVSVRGGAGGGGGGAGGSRAPGSRAAQQHPLTTINTQHLALESSPVCVAKI